VRTKKGKSREQKSQLISISKTQDRGIETWGERDGRAKKVGECIQPSGAQKTSGTRYGKKGVPGSCSVMRNIGMAVSKKGGK